MCVCVCVWLWHNTEIFQCFLSAREVARSRERERASSSTGLGSSSRNGGGGGGEEDTILAQEGRRGGTGLPEGQDLYTAACNSVIHRCALLILGVSPVLGELTKQNQEEAQTQLATGAQECLSFMTRSERNRMLLLTSLKNWIPLSLGTVTLLRNLVIHCAFLFYWPHIHLRENPTYFNYFIYFYNVTFQLYLI